MAWRRSSAEASSEGSGTRSVDVVVALFTVVPLSEQFTPVIADTRNPQMLRVALGVWRAHVNGVVWLVLCEPNAKPVFQTP
jgi:hypothetical protein